jgi:hypothetical protein
VVASETGELMWDGNQGFFTVNNPHWQGATGYLGGKTIELGNITISDVTTTDNLNFASIQLISLDSLPISQSKKMILLTSARLENQGLKWNDAKTALVSAGGTRALCEPVEAAITFKTASTDSLSVYMLNQTGKRADSLLVSQLGESAKFSLNKNTLWYEISNHVKKPVTSGKKTEINKNMMNIYPNPGKEYSVIEYSFPENTEASFFIYNSTGQLIMQEPVLVASNKTERKTVDTTRFADGIYYYGFRFINGEKVIDKLVISK